ncbi:MAG: DNA repair exonuclease [Candidatus Methanoplasma sp.]|jgi:DNA repair exonuclease SbcCD nuclease subunit|nr:DNA repair exonuclease [Candidatus Methanoplasma sp.]
MPVDFKFIHCADLHLGSRFKGVSESDPELGKKLFEAMFSSFRKIVDLALSEQADFVVVSGDVFDEENESPRVRYRLSEELKRLDVPCIIALGNHDFRRSWESSIPFPDNVRVFSPEPDRMTVRAGKVTVEIIGRSFPSRHTEENFVASLRGNKHMFTVAVLHCNLDTFSDDRRYAPCSPSDLLNRDVDYWALGHIHKRTVVRERPHAVYPGNIQGRDRTETGEKGAYVVSVSNNEVSELRFVPTQELLWVEAEASISGKDMRSFLSEVRSKMPPGSVASLRVTGRGDLDAVLRLDPGMSKTISDHAGCILSSLELNTSPSVDVSSFPENSIVRMVSESARRTSSAEKDKIISKICSTRLSADIRRVFDNMSDEEVKAMVRDAEMLIAETLGAS